MSDTPMLHERIVQAEQAVLGSILISPEVLGEVLARIRPDDFMDAKYRHLYQAAARVHDAGAPVDAVTVLDKAGQGYEELIRSVMDATPTAANVFAYCDILHDGAALYRIREMAEGLAEAEDLPAAQKTVGQMGELLGGHTGLVRVTMSELLREFFAEQRQAARPGVRFGLDFLDETVSVEPGNLIFLAARPGDGKTALALQMAVAMAAQHRVGYFSLEMGRRAIANRIMAASWRQDKTKLTRHELDKQMLDGFEAAVMRSTFAGLPFDYYDACGKSVSEIRYAALAARYDVIFVDYAQLCAPERDLRNTVSELEETSKALRSLANRGVLVVGLLQLNRNVEDSAKSYRLPRMSDIKGSGQFEQDADAILILGKQVDGRGEGARFVRDGRVLLVDKNREGVPAQAVNLTFDGKIQRFSYRSMRTDEPPAPPPPPERHILKPVYTQEQLPF